VLGDPLGGSAPLAAAPADGLADAIAKDAGGA
jgi:hypothetical protein